MTSRIHAPSNGRTARSVPAWAGGVLFFAGLVVTSIAFTVFASRPLPLPTAESTAITDFYTNEQVALWVAGVSHLLSATGLVIFVRRTRRYVTSRGAGSAAFLAAGALALTGLITWLVAAMGTGLSDSAIVVLVRTAFHLGGVVHIVALGVFGVIMVATAGPWGRAKWLRVPGMTAAIVACSSVLSVVVEPASLLLPAGRILCMVWIVCAGIALPRLVGDNAAKQSRYI